MGMRFISINTWWPTRAFAVENNHSCDDFVYHHPLCTLTLIYKMNTTNVRCGLSSLLTCGSRVHGHGIGSGISTGGFETVVGSHFTE